MKSMKRCTHVAHGKESEKMNSGRTSSAFGAKQVEEGSSHLIPER